MQKREARDFVQSKMDTASSTDLKKFNESIFKNFKKLFDLNNPLKIGSYISKENEVSTDKINQFILDQGSSLYLPKIFNCQNSKKLKFYQFNEDDSLEQNKFGVLEPLGLGKSLKPKYLDLIIIPVRGINKNNKRLGYGGGYYDRSLAREKKLKFLTICFDFQKNLSFRSQKHDIEISTIISPNGYLRKAW